MAAPIGRLRVSACRCSSVRRGRTAAANGMANPSLPKVPPFDQDTSVPACILPHAGMIRSMEARPSGPLAGVRIVELAGLGPVPFAAMMLADLGAEIIRVARPGLGADPAGRMISRGRPELEIDLKDSIGIGRVLSIIEKADVLLEGFRPGVMERLGLGPGVCLAKNPRLVYGRMTGWGQDGPLAARAGHDIDYIALAGVLSAFARQGQAPMPPVNLVGDYAGGALFLIAGVLAALLERAHSGRGQVVDAAMVDGAAYLGTALHSLRAQGTWTDVPGTNILDTGAPFYDVYETSDGGYMAVGAIEPQFYALLLAGLGLDADSLPAQMDRDGWPAMKERFAAVFRSRSRDQWTAVFEATDACVTPVLTLTEAARHPHNAARETFTTEDGALRPFSRSAAGGNSTPSSPELLARWGVESMTASPS